MKTGTRVKTWDGAEGTIEYQTADGWYGVRTGTRVDEYQWWQVEAA